MANKRDLKQTINLISSELFAEGVSASLYCNEENNDAANDVISAIVLMHADFISRISHPEPGMSQKLYFKNLIEDFNKQASEIIDQLNSLG